MDAHRYYAPAALAAAYRAFQAGNDVYSALSALGYGYATAQGLAEYYNSRFAEPPPLDAATQSQGDEPMSTTTTTTARVKRRRGSYGSTVAVSKGVKRYVKGCVDRMLEIKVFQFAQSGTIQPGTGGAFAGAFPSQIVQGDTDGTRDGNIIHVKRLALRIVSFDSAAFVLRLILVVDRQSNGASPAVTDVLAAANYQSDYNASTVVGHGGSRFAILWERHFVCNPNITATGTFGGVVNKSWKMNMPVTYIGNAGTAADISKNNIYLLGIGSTATAGYSYAGSLTYTDN